MSFEFTGYQTRSTRFQEELEAPMEDVLGATAAQAISELPIPSIRRFYELSEAQQSAERLDAVTARQKLTDAGLDGRLKIPDNGISAPALDILMERKREEIQRQEILSRAPAGLGTGAAQLGMAFAASALDPLNVGLAFVPVVGQARYLRYLAGARGVLGRAGVRAGVGAVEGAAGAAIIEPFVLTAKTQEQADYDMQDSLLNVAFGTVFGGGLHTVAAGVSDAARSLRGEKAPWTGLRGLDDADITLVQNLRREIDRGMDLRDVSRAIEGYSPAARRSLADVLPAAESAAARIAAEPLEVRETALRTAVSQAMRGRAVDVESVLPSLMDSPMPKDHIRLYHGGNSDLSEIEDSGVFGGIFASEDRGAAASHGDGSVFNMDIPVSEVLTQRALDYVIEHDSTISALRKAAHWIDDDADLELAYKAVVEDKAYQLDPDDLKRIFREDEVGTASWEAQRIRGQVAKELGYRAVEMSDEHGTTYLVLPGIKVARSGGSAAKSAVSVRQSSADRQVSPASDLSSDVRAAEVADIQVAQSPKGEDLELNEATLADELLSLKDSMRIAGNESLMDELAPFDEALVRADEYGKAAKAAVLCGLGH